MSKALPRKGKLLGMFNSQATSRRRPLWAPPFALMLALCASACTSKTPQAESKQPAESIEKSAATTPTEKPALVNVFPHVRVDRSAGIVEFDGEVPIDCHIASAPVVYLELIACTHDTREHEALIVTSAKPSHIHAALLMLGLEPGKPATWTRRADGSLEPHPPSGAELTVEFVTRDASGAEVVTTPMQWITHAKSGEPFPAGQFVFAGSVFVKRQGEERYDADWSGTLVGLTTFGTEVIAWKNVISPDSWVDEPVWIADSRIVPKVGDAVVVRLRSTPKQ